VCALFLVGDDEAIISPQRQYVNRFKKEKRPRFRGLFGSTGNRASFLLLRADFVAAREPIRFCRRVHLIAKKGCLGPREIGGSPENFDSVLVLHRVGAVRLLEDDVTVHCVLAF